MTLQWIVQVYKKKLLLFKQQETKSKSRLFRFKSLLRHWCSLGVDEDALVKRSKNIFPMERRGTKFLIFNRNKSRTQNVTRTPSFYSYQNARVNVSITRNTLQQLNQALFLALGSDRVIYNEYIWFYVHMYSLQRIEENHYHELLLLP